MKKILMLAFLITITGCSAGLVKESHIKVEVKEKSFNQILEELLNKKKFDEIIALYVQKKDIFKTPEELKYLIMAYYNKGEYKKVIDVSENYPDILKSLIEKEKIAKIIGISYYKMERYEQAKRLFEILLEQDNKDEDYMVYLFVIYMKKGQFSNAMRISSNLAFEKKNFLQGLLYIKEENFKRAIEKFSEIKNNDRAMVLLSYCFFRNKDYDNALNLIEEKGLEKYPLAYLIKAIILSDRGEVKKSLEMLNKLKESVDISDEIKSVVWVNIGIILETYFDDVANAISAYKKSLELKDNEIVKGFLSN